MTTGRINQVASVIRRPDSAERPRGGRRPRGPGRHTSPEGRTPQEVGMAPLGAASPIAFRIRENSAAPRHPRGPVTGTGARGAARGRLASSRRRVRTRSPRRRPGAARRISEARGTQHRTRDGPDGPIRPAGRGGRGGRSAVRGRGPGACERAPPAHHSHAARTMGCASASPAPRPSGIARTNGGRDRGRLAHAALARKTGR